MLKVLSILCDLDPKVKVIGQKAGICDGVPSTSALVIQMKTKWTKWYAMTLHVFAYRSLELLFSMHTFHFNCFFEDFNCIFTQIRCLSRVLCSPIMNIHNIVIIFFSRYLYPQCML